MDTRCPGACCPVHPCCSPRGLATVRAAEFGVLNGLLLRPQASWRRSAADRCKAQPTALPLEPRSTVPRGSCGQQSFVPRVPVASSVSFSLPFFPNPSFPKGSTFLGSRIPFRAFFGLRVTNFDQNIVQPIPLGVTFSNAVSKLKAQSSNICFN